ncbi:MAG: hypothetical protein B6I38_01855 [Anaerolineaceae bacterium 4572_5.1]|nr:MAG: hypothetical protein B5M51_03980 [Anaerolinea sp. 4484_236]OQY34996.1 MAG: hypothetical protein B6I38_01855 [Anaerolineaceae bacterium 4572_5.1]
MDILLNPNTAYLLLVSGVLLTLFAIVTPGTGFLEVGAFFSLALAGYAVYHLPVHVWALILLILSLVPFILAIRKERRALYLGLSIVGVVIGSAYMFKGEGNAPAVHPVLVSVVSLLMGGFLWLVVNKVLEALDIRPTHDLGVLEGQTGEAKTEIHDEGSVQVSGELWTARSENPIPAGTRIRVTKRDGFILQVEPVDHLNK